MAAASSHHGIERRTGLTRRENGDGVDISYEVPSWLTVKSILDGNGYREGLPPISSGYNIDRTWRRTAKKAEIPHVTIHGLRRTCCTRLVRAGVPVSTVQRPVGHENIETTVKYYNRVDTSDLREGVRKLKNVAG